MNKHAPPPATRNRESTLLIVIAALALAFGALSIYMRGVTPTPTALDHPTLSDEPPSKPLPAGPRKYP
jgi:hypothetical protein